MKVDYTQQCQNTKKTESFWRGETNKKSDLMLTRRAKAYSSSGSVV